MATLIMPILALLLGASVGRAPAKDQSRPITLRVSPTVCLAPCDIRVSVRIEPHPLNRWFVLQLDGPVFQGSMRQVDGEDAPPTQDSIWFRGLPAGEYELTAIVYRATAPSEAGRATAHVIVSGEDR